MKSSIAPAARSSQPFAAVRVDSHDEVRTGVAETSVETAASVTAAAEFRRFAGEAPTRFRDYMGYHGCIWSSMESDYAADPPTHNYQCTVRLNFSCERLGPMHGNTANW